MLQARLALLQMASRGLAAAFRSWREAIVSLALQKEKVAACLFRLRSRLTSSAFNAWASKVTEKEDALTKVACALQSQDMKVVLRCCGLCTWSEGSHWMRLARVLQLF